MYNDEIIHFSAGINDYIGRLQQTAHPNGPNWYRLNDVCIVFQQRNQKNQRIEKVLAPLSGPYKEYRKFIDIRVPEDSIIEVRVVDKNGKLYEIYKKEIDRVFPQNIIIPESGALTGIN